MAKKKVEKVSQPQQVPRDTLFAKYKWEILIFSFAFLLYLNCIPNSYNMDDELVTRNHRLTSKGISAIPEIFTSFYYKDESGYAYEYRPVVPVSFAIEHQIFGDNPYISHFFNVLLYALCCVLLYRVLLLMMGEEWGLLSLAITFLFIAHPAHTEVVASIKNRDDILSLIFSLLAVYIALKAVMENKKWLLIFSPLTFVLGLLSKMTAFSFVIIIPAILIIFTNAGFITVMAISFLFILISIIFVTNVYDSYEKIIRVIEFIILVATLYGLVNITRLYNQAKAVIKELPLKKDRAPAATGNGWVQFSFDGIFRNIIPDGPSFSFWPIFISSVGLAAYLFGLYRGHISASIFAIVILIFSVIYKNLNLRAWAGLALSACMVFTFREVPFTNESIFGTVIFIHLIYQVFLGDRRVFIPNTVLLGCLLYFSFAEGHMTHSVFVYLFLLIIHVIIPIVAFKSKRPWLIVIPVVILAAVLIGSFIGIAQDHAAHLNIQLAVYGYVFSLFILLALLFNLNVKRILTLGIFLMLLILTDPMGNNPLNDIRGMDLGARGKIDDYGKKVEIHILPTEQDRPLLYLEQPVNAKDPLQIRMGTSMEILFQYLHKVILPYPMAFYYGFRFIKPEKITDPIPLLSFIIYCILGILTVVFIYRDRIIAIGLIIYLVSVAAASNYFMPVPGQLGERFLLIPSLGWAIMLGMILFRIWKLNGSIKNFYWSGLNRNARYVFIGIMLFYSAITVARNFNWRDDLTLFQHDISYVNQSAQAHNLLALHLMQHSMTVNGDPVKQEEYWKEALAHFKRSYQIYPNFYNVAFDLGRLYSLLKEPDSSVFYFRKAISIDSSNTDAYANVGSILIGQQKFAEAIPYFECQIRRHPNVYNGYENLSFIYYNLGEYQKSISVNKGAVEKTPPRPDPLINIAQTFLTMNRADSAYLYVQLALRIDPTNPRGNKLLSNFRRNP